MRTKDDFCGLEKKSAKDDSPAPVLFRYFIRRKKTDTSIFFCLANISSQGLHFFNLDRLYYIYFK
jgi:hypothetical protein